MCGLPCKENPIYVFLLWELRGLSPIFHIQYVSDLYIPRIGPHISLQQNGRPILEIYKFLTDTVYECRNRETESFYSVLERTVSVVRIQKWEPDIYILASPSFAEHTFVMNFM